MKTCKYFNISAGIILLLTGVAKVTSASGYSTILQFRDPILDIPFEYLMASAGILEILIAALCLFGKAQTTSLILVAILSTNLIAYRLCLWRIGWRHPCPCLGTLTDALNISPEVADTTLKILLAYLFIGSYGALLWSWRQHRSSLQ